MGWRGAAFKEDPKAWVPALVLAHASAGDGEERYVSLGSGARVIEFLPEDVADDEPLHRLGEHRFALGEYVTVTDEDGRPLTYKVMQVEPVQ